MLVFFIFLTIGSYALTQQAQVTGARTRGLLDMIRDAEKRQKQLVEFVHSYENEGNLLVYLYNYGSIDARVERVWVAGEEPRSWEVYDASSWEDLENALPPQTMVCVKISGWSWGEALENTLVLLTESNSIYKWVIYK
jgi:hypothetical protein